MKIAITFHPARPVTTPLAQSNVASSFNARLTTRQPKMVYIKCTRIVYETFSPNENGIWIGTILSIIVFSFRVKNIICRQTKYYIYKKKRKKKGKEVLFVIRHLSFTSSISLIFSMTIFFTIDYAFWNFAPLCKWKLQVFFADSITKILQPDGNCAVWKPHSVSMHSRYFW